MIDGWRAAAAIVILSFSLSLSSSSGKNDSFDPVSSGIMIVDAYCSQEKFNSSSVQPYFEKAIEGLNLTLHGCNCSTSDSGVR